MTTRNLTTCCSEPELQRYVAEGLDTCDDARVAAHVDQCAACRSRMANVVADSGAWRSADHLGGVREDVVDTHPENRRELELQQLRQHLAPTDDPTKLGRLGHYEICGLIGSGSMGMVVKAFEPQLNRYVAIKVLSPIFASNGAARLRFQRESRAIAAVKHQHVVPVHAVDDDGGLPYLVMQYADGGSLDQRFLQHGPLSSCEVARIGMQIARGLAEAHCQGIIHRDVKPANVMLEAGVDRAMVTDFGLARVADDAAQTRSGVIAGTPQYMSPEQARGDTVDPRTDLFSLGATMYAACTGRPPFRADSVFGVIRRVCESTPRPIRELNPSIEPWLAAFIDRLLQKSPADRFQSAAEVADLLSQELAHQQNPTVIPPPQRPWQPKAQTSLRWSRHGAIAAALAAIVLALAFGPRTSAPESNHGDAVTPASAGIPSTPTDPGTPSSFSRAGVLPAILGNNERSPRLRPVSFIPSADSRSLERETADLGTAGEFVATRKSYPGGIIDGYGLYLPRSYNDTEKRYPVLMFLGGGCAVGGKVSQACYGCLPDEIRSANKKIAALEGIIEGGQVPLAEHYRLLVDEFIVVAPHMKGGSFDERQFFNQEKAIEQILDELAAGCRTDPTRTYVAGAGRGGHGALGLASRMPHRFAATVAIRGQTFGITDYEAIAKMPLWVGHCTEDSQVEFRQSAELVAKLETNGEKFLRIGQLEAGGTDYMQRNRVFTSYRGEGYPNLFEHPQVLRWLLRFQSNGKKPSVGRASPGSTKRGTGR